MDNIQLPPESIATNTAAILKACEMAEISGTTTTSNHSFILVTQLASLLFLRQYNHARHLWRRYSPPSPPSSSDTEMQDSTTSTSMVADGTGGDDLHQFQLLWNAAQPLLKSYYGNVSLLESSTSVYTSLQSCVEANLHPLSVFALELKGQIRNQMVDLIETVYDSIPDSKCYTLLGKLEGGESEDDVESYLLTQRKWMRDETTKLWIPATAGSHSTSSDNGGKEEKNRIDFLSNVVGFMEKQHVH